MTGRVVQRGLGIVLLIGMIGGSSWFLAGAEEQPGEEKPILSGFPSIDSIRKPGQWLDRPGLLEPEKTSAPQSLWPDLDSTDRVNATFRNQMEGLLGLLSSQMVVQDARNVPDDPGWANRWKTEEAVQMNVTGPVSFFGHLGASCDSMEGQDLKLTGKTGLAWKLSGQSPCELLVRGGPSLSCADPLKLDRAKDQSELLLELQCKCPLPGQVKLEYLSSATPALSLTERDRLKQDLGVLFPLGPLGQFRIGAKHTWENTTVAKSRTDSMQFYIGLDLKR